MLTKTQLKAIASRQGINPYYQEKDYLQNIFLFNLFKVSREFVFKGGTCLKIAYNYMRFSEDLDFNSELEPRQIQKTVAVVLKSFELLGIKHEFIEEKLFENAYTSRIRFYSSFYTGSAESTNSIQLDIGKRDEVVLKPRWIQVNSPYADIPKFFVLAMDEEEILAEKIRALVMRGKPRDLFDLWAMTSAGVEVREELIDKKLSSKKIEIKLPEEKLYERDLRNMLSVVPPYQQVIEDLNRKMPQKFESGKA